MSEYTVIAEISCAKINPEAALNKVCLARCADYCSYHSFVGSPKVVACLEKDGEFISCFPPLGDSVRDTIDEAMSNSHVPTGVSDHMNHWPG